MNKKYIHTHTHQGHITLGGESNVRLRTVDTMGVQMMLVMLKVGCSEKPGKRNQSHCWTLKD